MTERTYKTIAGVTYADLDATLTGLGYVRKEVEKGTDYLYPKDEKARIPLPKFPLSAEIRGIDFIAARAIVDGFGILDAKDFESLLMRTAHKGDSASSANP